MMKRQFRPGEFVLRWRLPIGGVLLLTSVVMAYFTTKVQIRTRFVDFFPARHSYVSLNRKFVKFGGANTLILVLETRQGDIFNHPLLQKIHDLTEAVDRLPGVNHNEVLSLASERVSFADAVPGAIVSRPFMHPGVPQTPEEIRRLKADVAAHRNRLRYLVSHDARAAAVTAAFNENGFDSRVLFDDIQRLVNRYQDSTTRVYVAGEPVVRGYGYYYMPLFTTIFVACVAVMAGILFLTLGYSTGWWTPLLTGSLSAIWGLGFVGVMHYDFDPVMLVIPFILTARDISHGIQWQGRYYDEVIRLGDKHAALAATTDYMFPPGLLSILADIAGVIFISFGGIPALHRIALAGAVWLAGSLTMVFIFQPILMSFMPRPRPRPVGCRWAAVKAAGKRLVDRMALFAATRSTGRGLLLLGALVGIAWGVASGLRQRVGDSQPGTPLYGSHAKINQDIASISRNFPSDQGWIIVTTPPYPSPDFGLAPAVARMEDSLRNFLLADPAVIDVISFASTVMKPSNQMLNYGFPKYFSAPGSIAMAGTLWQLYLGGSAPGEMQQFFTSALTKEGCIRVLLRDHTSATLNDLRARIEEFVRQRVNGDPALAQVHISYLGGGAGLYAAANDVLYRLDFLNITFVLGVVFLFCVVTFRSAPAGLMFVLSCILANFGAFIYLRLREVGLTIDTIPVISLGIGLGVDYGIYVVSRIRDEVRDGAGLEDAVVTAISTTGVAVLSTFAVMIGGIALWGLSPLRFHSEMSMLLVFLMFTNLVSGVLILPCYIAWARPRFICRFESAAEGGAKTWIVAAF